jgi:hypothetical protein
VLGKRLCEIALSDILMKLGDSKITKRITNQVFDCKEGIKSLERIERGRKTFLELWRNHQLKIVEERKIRFQLPEVLYTHLRCVLESYFSEAFKKAQDENKCRNKPKAA